MNKVIYLITLFLLLLAAGCKDDNEDMQKYSQPFLGQWKKIACGNDMYPELPSDGHVIEFLPDGTVVSGSRTRSYRADAEFLYYDSGTVPDGHTWRYTFTGADTLRLDHADGLLTSRSDTPTFYIYERCSDGCEDLQEDMEKYRQAFLGEWQEIVRGNETDPELPPYGGILIEFLPGGAFSGGFDNANTYRADAEFLYYGSETEPDRYTCRYAFTGADTLRLDIVDGLISAPGVACFFIYKRYIDKPEYRQPFLGQWREIGRGNDTYPELTPDGHVIEFLPDGTFIHGGTGSYRADAGYLYYDSGTIPDGFAWCYTFTGADTLRLDIVDGLRTLLPTTPDFYIYERLTTNEP